MTGLTGADTSTVTITGITGSHILVIGNAGQLIDMDVAGANTLTIPPNGTVDFPVGTTIFIRQKGAGVTTITPGAAVVINNPDGLKTTGQYAMATIIQITDDTWTAFGSLEA